jgi:hypothetical protein
MALVTGFAGVAAQRRYAQPSTMQCKMVISASNRHLIWYLHMHSVDEVQNSRRCT